MVLADPPLFAAEPGEAELVGAPDDAVLDGLADGEGLADDDCVGEADGAAGEELATTGTVTLRPLSLVSAAGAGAANHKQTATAKPKPAAHANLGGRPVGPAPTARTPGGGGRPAVRRLSIRLDPAPRR
ncbi:MAG: hypothetical protein LBD97_09055 [Bifidobacteriaceae bacterium]|nr:hypothetical protein [Bifidobacteriaceae bacterium]